VGNEINRVEPAHVLLFEEIGGVALALGEDRDQHVGTGHFLAARGLNVDHRPLDDALEGGRRAGVLPVGHNEAVEFLVDEVLEVAFERLDIDIAAIEHGDRLAVVGQGQQQMLECSELMAALARQVHRLVQSLFKSA
jgi:hypothetical protein